MDKDWKVTYYNRIKRVCMIMVSNHKVFGHQMNVCISRGKIHLLVGSDVVLTRHIFMTSFPAARKNVKSSI